MKILQPNEVKTTKDTQLQRDILRIQNVKSVLQKEQQKLDTATASFEVMLSNQRVRWADAEQKATNRIVALNKEVTDLEEKRANLLIPIHLDEERARIKLEEAETVFSEAAQQLELNEEAAETLQDKLDSVSEREQNCTDLEQKLGNREQNLKVQEATISTLSTELSDKWEEFFTKKALYDAQVATDKKNIFIALANIEERRKSQDTRELSLNARETRLADERHSFEKYLKNGKRKT